MFSFFSCLLHAFVGYCSEGPERDRSMSGDSTALRFKSEPIRRIINQSSIEEPISWMPEITEQKQEESKQMDLPIFGSTLANVEISVHQETPTTPPATSCFLPASVSSAVITTLGSADNLNGETNNTNFLSGPSSPSNLSSVTLVGSTGSGAHPQYKDSAAEESQQLFKYSHAPTSPLPERKRKISQASITHTVETNAANKNGGIKVETTAAITLAKVAQSEIEKITTKISESISSKPTIVSAITKSSLKETLAGKIQSKTSGSVLQPAMDYLTMNRRPSTGTIGVPMAALTQHRRSLQLNSSEFGMPKVILIILLLLE